MPCGRLHVDSWKDNAKGKTLQLRAIELCLEVKHRRKYLWAMRGDIKCGKHDILLELKFVD